MNRQKIFDKVVTHLKNQKARAYSVDEDHCLYRDEDSGYRCAVGCLIPDELYDRNFEGESIDTLVHQNTAIAGLLQIGNGTYYDEDVRFLRSLQQIHDEREIDMWARAFHGVAERYALQWNHTDWLNNETAS